MRYLTLGEVVALHRAIGAATGGADGIRDLGALESALAQPKATFGGTDLYPSIVDKASALAFGLAMNHPFVDGNKRIAHAAMAVFLDLNGFEIEATVDEQEQLMLGLAAGQLSRADLTTWLESHVSTRKSSG
jgi:death-on-curing protein